MPERSTRRWMRLDDLARDPRHRNLPSWHRYCICDERTAAMCTSEEKAAWLKKLAEPKKKGKA